MGHAKEIITLDVYGDKSQIIADGVEEIQPYMEEVLPKAELNMEDLLEVEIDIDMALGQVG